MSVPPSLCVDCCCMLLLLCLSPTRVVTDDTSPRVCLCSGGHCSGWSLQCCCFLRLCGGVSGCGCLFVAHQCRHLSHIDASLILLRCVREDELIERLPCTLIRTAEIGAIVCGRFQFKLATAIVNTEMQLTRDNNNTEFIA